MSAKIDSYGDLVVWRKSVDLAVAVYGLTKAWPKEEIYGLTSQTRRAATAVAANVAEGMGGKLLAPTRNFFELLKAHSRSSKLI